MNRLLTRRCGSATRLPACFSNSRDLAGKCHITESDPGYPKIPHVTPRASTHLATVFKTNR